MILTSELQHKFSESEKISYPDWEVKSGEQALILGASGSGKTTFLHLISGLLQIQHGKVTLADKSIGDLDTHELDKLRGEKIGLVFQKPHLIQSLSVKENIRTAAFFGRKKVTDAEILELMKQLGVEKLADRKVYNISYGQAQRVAIARAVIKSPDYIFGDEPTASLDDASCMAVIGLLKEQAQKCNATLVLATHDHRVKSEFENHLAL